MVMKIDEFIKLLHKRESDKQRKKLDALSQEEFVSLATQVSKEGDTALIAAATVGHEEIVERLLSVGGVDVNHVDKDGDTALTHAAMKGHKEVVESLLSVGVEVNYANKHGDTALLWAANKGHKEIVERLLSVEGVDVNHANKEGNTALLWAAVDEHKEIIERLLLVEGVDVNHANSDGNTVLIWAAYKGHKEIVERLLSDVNHANNNGATALMIAAYNGHKEIVERLLSVGGVDVNHTNQHGHTALIQAVRGHYKEIVERLLSVEGVDVNYARESGGTALSIAAARGQQEIVAVVAFAGFKQSMREGKLDTAKQQLEEFYTGKSKFRKEKNTKIQKLYSALLEEPKPDWAVGNLSEIDKTVLKLTKKDTEVNQTLHVLIGKRLLQDASKEGLSRKLKIDLLKEVLEHASSAPKAEGSKVLASEAKEKLAELNITESELKPATKAKVAKPKSSSWPDFFGRKRKPPKAKGGDEKESLLKRRPSDPGRR